MSTEPAQRRQKFRRTEATAYLREKHGIDRAAKTLAKLASIGGGPFMTYIGRIPFYTPDALDAYAQKITSRPVRSTADRRQAMAESDAGA
jgi:hypothetical protein